MITANHDRHVAGRLKSDAAGQRRIAIRGACSSRDARLPGRRRDRGGGPYPGITARRDTAAQMLAQQRWAPPRAGHPRQPARLTRPTSGPACHHRFLRRPGTPGPGITEDGHFTGAGTRQHVAGAIRPMPPRSSWVRQILSCRGELDARQQFGGDPLGSARGRGPRWCGPYAADQVADAWVAVERGPGHAGCCRDGAEIDGLAGAVQVRDGVAGFSERRLVQACISA
jgi:hypothetical protein